MRLVIAEKPSLAKEIAAAIGTGQRSCDGYIDAGGVNVSWCVGHVLEQAMPQDYDAAFEKWVLEHLPILPQQWKLLAKASTKAQVSVLKKLIREADEVIHAGDGDREGQLIVDELLHFCGFKGQVQRLWLQDLTPSGIKKAWAAMKPNAEFQNLSAAALGRQRSDWLLGINLTRAYSIAWGQAGNRGALHVGRVQTPTLGLIVARDLEIENFVPKDYFAPLIKLRHANGEFGAVWQPKADMPGLDDQNRIIDRAVAQALAAKLAGQAGVIASAKTERKKQPPPLPFTLAAIQKLGNKFGMSPQKVLDVCQSLYEKHKMLSYPRTDCPYLAEADHANAPTVIAAIQGNLSGLMNIPAGMEPKIKSHAFDDKKLGAHTGIIPTPTQKHGSELSADELVIYKLVARQYLAQFYAQREFDSTILLIEAAGESLKATGRQEIKLGWKALFGADEDDTEPTLPRVQQGDQVKLAAADVVSKKTTPPPRFDGSSLVDAMENIHKFVTKDEVKKRLRETDGLGTPATRGVIIENLVSREYLAEVKEGKKNVLISTPKGRQLIKSVPKEISAPDLTAYFESLLKQVEEGTFELAKFEGQQARFVTKLVDAVKSGEVAASMPRIADNTVARRPSKPASKFAKRR